MILSVKEDIYRYHGNDCRKLGIRLAYFFKPYTRYFWYFRHAQTAKSIFAKAFYKIMMRRLKYQSGAQIPPETIIGRGFRMLHFGSIVIHPEAVIGNNMNMAQGTLIGESFIHGVSGVPTIGNNCCMFANSMIVGGVHVGNDVLVAPGAFVNFDVPDNSVVVGNPGKIITRTSSPTKKYIVYLV